MICEQEILIAIANQPDASCNVFTEECLRNMALADTSLHYDELTQQLWKKIEDNEL